MTEHNESVPKTAYKFRVGAVVWMVLILLYVLAVISHNASDLCLLEGGTDTVLTESNWIGFIGAHIARAVFYLFGLAVYPAGILLIACAVRGFLPQPLKRQGYAGCVLSALFGIVLLMSMWPEHFQTETQKLGIGRVEHPDMCLSGGAFGAVLAAPPVCDKGIQIEAGLLRRHIGEAGTLVVALAFLLPGLFFIFMQDWYPMLSRSIRASRQPGPAPVPDPAPPVEEKPVAEPPQSDPPPPPSANASGAQCVLPLSERLKILFTGKNPQIPAEEPSLKDEEQKTTEKKVSPAPPAEEDSDEPEENPVEDENTTVNEEEEEEPYVVAPPPGIHSLMPQTETAVPMPPVSNDVPRVSAPPPPQALRTPAANEARITQYSEEKTKYDREKPSGSGEGAHPTINCIDYTLPPVALLDKQLEVKNEDSAHIEQSRECIQKTLESFNVDGHVSEIVVGPRVTRFEITLAAGVKVEKVTGIQNNIAMDLAAESIRILAPIPGKSSVGIEVPNKVSSIVYLRSLMETASWRENRMTIPIILGRDIAGKVIVMDLAKAPHLLIAGSTGSGKSVCMNTLIMSLLFKYTPAELRLIMVDPKVVELEMYRPIPHLITPVVNDPTKVPLALRWGVNEMERRYRVLARVKAKNLAAFNSRPADPVPVLDEEGDPVPPKLPLVIIIIDELADIMMTEAKKDVENSICRIAQKGRAAGIHLVIATQTPRKEIITGTIKTNLPSKIAFKVGSNMDSRVILESGGAERLLGQGDMLFMPPGACGLERIQGAMVSDPEIQKVVDFVSGQVEQHFDSQVIADDVQVHNGDSDGDADDEYSPRSDREDSFGPDPDDIVGDLPGNEMIEACARKHLRPNDPPLLKKALEIIIMEQKASTSYLQRRLGIGYNKSAELMDQLEQRGIISAPLPGGQKRNILITDGLEQNDVES